MSTCRVDFLFSIQGKPGITSEASNPVSPSEIPKCKIYFVIKVNKSFRRHIQDCHDALQIRNDGLPCFISRKNTVYSTQRISVKLKYIKVKYGVRIGNFSTHTLRKTFGCCIFEKFGENAEMALSFPFLDRTLIPFTLFH